jgi:hypothetical protein
MGMCGGEETGVNGWSSYFAELVGGALGITLLTLGALGWAGRIRAVSGWPPGSAPSRRAGRAWFLVGIGELITTSSDAMYRTLTTSLITVVGACIMVASLLAALRVMRSARNG